MALNLTRYTVPPDQVVGKVWHAWDGNDYRCLHRDPRKGFWMQMLDTPEPVPAGQRDRWGRYIDGCVFGWTWHLAAHQPAQELAA